MNTRSRRPEPTSRYKVKNGVELKRKLNHIERERERSRTITLSVLVGLALIAMIGMIVLLTGGRTERPQLEFINRGVIERSEAATALIVREETLLVTPADGTLNKTIEEGGRVRKNGRICAVTSSLMEDKLQELYGVEDEIALRQNQLMRLGDYKDVSAVYNQSEAELSAILNALRGDAASNQLEDFLPYQVATDLILTDRKTALLNTDLRSEELRTLIDKRAELLSELEEASESIYAPAAGIISYMTDGLEDELDFENAQNMTVDELSDYLRSPDKLYPLGREIEEGQPAARLITNIRQYLIVWAPNLKSTYFDQNQKSALDFRLDNEGYVIEDCVIDRIVPDGEGTMIVLRTDRQMNELQDRRVVTGSLRTSFVKGLKVPKDAVIKNAQDSSLGWIMVGRQGYTVRVPIRILDSDRTHSIIEVTDPKDPIIEGTIVVVNPEHVKEGEPID
ncbi:MAG: HlyD family efflux transporter periplasmic adaptor subunit [Fastidiosipilaceae bacterium]|jgi:hypothetical protein